MLSLVLVEMGRVRDRNHLVVGSLLATLQRNPQSARAHGHHFSHAFVNQRFADQAAAAGLNIVHVSTAQSSTQRDAAEDWGGKCKVVARSWNVTSLTPHMDDAMSLEGTRIQRIQEASLNELGCRKVAESAAVNGWSMISGQPVYKRGCREKEAAKTHNVHAS